MSSTPIQSDIMLWHTLRTRRKFHEPLKGLDAVASRWTARAKHARRGMGYLSRTADAVVAVDDAWRHLTNAQLDEKMLDLREAFARRNYRPEHVVQGLAAIREIAHRTMGEKPYRVQIMGALGLFHGQIVEMVTGEGKTLTAAVAATLLGWLRKPVHVITVNDYLAQRDADSRNVIFKRCGLRAGAVTGESQGADRRRLYRLPIVYTTQKEIVADWLRDQLQLGRIADPISTRWLAERKRSFGLHPADALHVPGLHVAIVDEADAVLIDEAVTPLIIAQPREEDAQASLYERARDLARQLTLSRHFKVEQKERRAKLRAAGRAHLATLLTDDEHVIWRAQRRREELVEQALVAEHCYHHRQHYQIIEDRVVIVDEYTGRFMEDRQWQHGLHQAVEAKHGLPVTADRDTLASMSFQRFFRQYPHLCGMTGTAADAKAELETTYRTPVRVIPTNRPIKRTRMRDLIFSRAVDKWHAVVEEIRQMHGEGRPVLVGTRSIDASEHLSTLLNEQGIAHQVLNAVHHKEEAQIIKLAGQSGSVTVATNMAGRGTDIKLSPGVAERGGLHVILTERHTASRIDRQLFGRSGRQGDPGSCRCIISLEDELVLKFAPSLSATLRQRYRGRHRPLPRWTRRVFDIAQGRAQKQAFRSRFNVLRHDEELDRTLPR